MGQENPALTNESAGLSVSPGDSDDPVLWLRDERLPSAYQQLWPAAYRVARAQNRILWADRVRTTAEVQNQMQDGFFHLGQPPRQV